MDKSSSGSSRIGFVKVFAALFALGIPGIVALIPTVSELLGTLPPELAELPMALVIALSLVNVIVLLAVAVAVGTLLAHRVGLRSLVAERVRTGQAIWPELRPHVVRAFIGGAAFMTVVIAADYVLDPFAGEELSAAAVSLGDLLAALIVGILYGGILEELLLRWGLMSALVWIGWRIIQRGNGVPKPALVWGGVILAALLFGIGHLPALAAMVEPTPLLIVRTVALNALGGLLFGWLYWRRSLEVAMVAHAGAHVALFVINAVLLLLRVPLG